MISAPQLYPELNENLALFLFWGGIIGLLITLLWKVVICSRPLWNKIFKKMKDQNKDNPIKNEENNLNNPLIKISGNIKNILIKENTYDTKNFLEMKDVINDCKMLNVMIEHLKESLKDTLLKQEDQTHKKVECEKEVDFEELHG